MSFVYNPTNSGGGFSSFSPRLYAPNGTLLAIGSNRMCSSAVVGAGTILSVNS